MSDPMRLTAADAQAILGFLADVDTIDAAEPYPAEFLARLHDLIPFAESSVEHLDLVGRRFIDVDPPEDPEEDALYWSVGPCPITEFRQRTGDLGPVVMSDVIGRQRYRETPFYRDYLRPVGLDHVLTMGLSMADHELRSIVLFRSADGPDFSLRDRAVLAALRPHLRAREARADLHQRAQDVAGPDDARPATHDALTPREREVVYLVAQGKSNAEIAAALWVTTGTVKKHLENVYVKLGVGSRTAAASQLQVAAATT